PPIITQKDSNAPPSSPPIVPPNPQSSPPAKPNDDEDDTISIFDLMDEPSTPQPSVTTPPPLNVTPPTATIDTPPLPLTTQPTKPIETNKPPSSPTEPTRTVNTPPQSSPPSSSSSQNSGRNSGRNSGTNTPPPPPIFAPGQAPSPAPPERDPDATLVQPRTAFPGETQIQPPMRQPVRETPQPKKVMVDTPSPKQRGGRQSGWFRNCLIRSVVILLALTLLGLIGGTIGGILAYRAIASDLPDPRELENRASNFETALIYDRNGQELYALNDPNAGNRTHVPLSEIAIVLQQATIATEDAGFYTNPGFSPVGIVRAVYLAIREQEVVSGASTITQQLVRAILLDEEERTQRTATRKIKEIILAAELYRTYPGVEGKEKILELYLNEIYYGNLAYGIEAAAQTYFDKSAADLTLAEASLLAGLPQAPAAWDPYSAPEKALGRQSEVLFLMTKAGYITPEEAQAALNEMTPIVRNMQRDLVDIKYPHFIFTVLQQLEEAGDAQSIYRGGLRIYTTIDPTTQELAENAVANARPNFNAGGANNAAMVVADPATGQILALVGSADFYDETISGQVNMALQPRQPGSTIKPLVYLAAMEQGWTPSTLIWDVETEFDGGQNQPPYIPKNYDDSFHGPLRLRPALGNSYNIPAVKALEYVGVCPFIERMNQLGINSLQDTGCAEVGQPRNYGLALSLGGGGISPFEMTQVYGLLANKGVYAPLHTISRIENREGDILFEREIPTADNGLFNPDILNPNQRVDPAHAYLLSDILSDNQARQPSFGQNNRLMIPGHRVAAKTGTSGTRGSDVRDGWTIGYSPYVVTAVWVGNTDNETVNPGQSGYGLASPIWNNFMTAYHAGRPLREFTPPSNIQAVEICADSGTKPSTGCLNRRTEIFHQDTPPLPSNQDFIQPIAIDLWTNQIANEHCNDAIYEANFFNLLYSGRQSVQNREQSAAQKWLQETGAGRSWVAERQLVFPLRLPPSNSCQPGQERPQVSITQPQANVKVTDIIEIIGTANAPNMSNYQLEYGLSHDPQGWAPIGDRRSEPVVNGLLGTLDTNSLPSGPITIRLTVFGPDNPLTEANDPVQASFRLPFFILEPTPTPTPSPTATPTETPTPTMTPILATPDDPPPTIDPPVTPPPEITREPTPTPIIITP
ncbi:MAG TPA: transglycosylase domain-containing protein, partial [Anaerolineae bacterium]|nr:transglycosylase domain-containing protein [Anaerolineae bacterium]